MIVFFALNALVCASKSPLLFFGGLDFCLPSSGLDELWVRFDFDSTFSKPDLPPDLFPDSALLREGAESEAVDAVVSSDFDAVSSDFASTSSTLIVQIGRAHV